MSWIIPLYLVNAKAALKRQCLMFPSVIVESYDCANT